MDAVEELSQCWDKHDKQRTQIVDDHVSGLSVFFLSEGEYRLLLMSAINSNLLVETVYD